MLEIATEALFLPGWKAVNREKWFKALSPKRQAEHRRCGLLNAEHEARELVNAIEGRDILAIKTLIRDARKRRLFEKLTGVALWKKDNNLTDLVLNRWAGPEAVAKADAAARADRRTIKLAARDRIRVMRNARLRAA